MSRTIQYQLQNCSWVDAAPDQIERMVVCILEREPWLAPRLMRDPMTTAEQVLAFLEAGHQLRYGDDWYDNIRVKPEPRPAIKPDLVRCDCGHDCEWVAVMSASLGTSCPNCYDRMSG